MAEDSQNKFIYLSLACSNETDPEILTEMAITEKDDEDICCAIARNINTPVNTLKYLCGWRATQDEGDSPCVKVSNEVINNPALPITVLEELLDRYINTGWLDLLNAFSKLSRLNAKMIGKLIERCDRNFWLIDHPIVQDSPELLDKIVHYSWQESIYLKVLTNNLVLTSTIEYLAGSPVRAVRNAVIAHPNVSKKALDIVLFMQGKPGIPNSILKDIVSDKRSHMVYLLTLYPYTTTEILENIIDLQYFDSFFEGYKYRIDGKDILVNIAVHPNISGDLLQKLMKISHQVYPLGHSMRIVISNLIRKQLLTLHTLSVNLPEKVLDTIVNENLRYSWSNLYEPIPEDEIPF